MFEMKNKYRVTIFLASPFKELKHRLRGVGFKEVQDTLVWENGDQSFEIMPFRKQSGHYGSFGYRVLFNYDMDTALYIFESSLVFFKPYVTNVEFQWWKEGTTHNEWRSTLLSFNEISEVDSKGIFVTGKVSLYLLDDTCLIQYRTTTKDNLHDCIRKVDSVKALLKPAHIDLLSFA